MIPCARRVSPIIFLFLVPFGILTADSASAARLERDEMLGRWHYLTSVDHISDVSHHFMIARDTDPVGFETPRFNLSISCVSGEQKSFTVTVWKAEGEFEDKATTASVDARVDKQPPFRQTWGVFFTNAFPKDAKLSRAFSAAMLTGQTLFVRLKPNAGFQVETEFNLHGYAEAFARLSSDCKLDH